MHTARKNKSMHRNRSMHMCDSVVDMNIYTRSATDIDLESIEV